MTRSQISGLAIAVLGMLVFFITPFQVESITSGAFPQIISVFLMLFGILVVFTSRGEASREDVRVLDPLLLCYTGLVLGAVILVRSLGFYPAILIVLPACLLLFGERDPKKIAGFSAITTGMIYIIIDLILGSQLP